MTKKSIFNMIFSIAFIGVVLSISVYFALTLVLRPEHNINSDYFESRTAARSGFSDFDDACLKNRSFHESIIETEYRLFGSLFGDNVIKGKSGFLFMGGVNELGYDYASDYAGETVLGDEALDVVYQYIEMRKKAYENRGIDYYLAVIPNSQTVYGEYMPDIYGKPDNDRVLSQVSRYLDSVGFDRFIDLTDAMIASKPEGLLYNNTENSINALGAYYVYEAIMKEMSGDVVDADRITELGRYALYTHYTDGKTAAELAGISSIVENETVSMSNDTEYMYTTAGVFGDLETTYTRAGYKEELPLLPSVLIEVTREWDKIQLKPYFSNTFGMASYRVSHNYSSIALDNSNPTVVVQVLHEDELMSVIEPTVSASYEIGLEPGQDPYKTTRPRDMEYILTDENTVCITGEVESGAQVSVFGEELDSYTVNEIGGRFVTVLRLDEPAAGREILVRAKTEGKLMSDPVSIVISGEKLSDSVTGEAIVGSNSMIYLSDYGASSIPGEDVLEDFSDRIKKNKEKFDSVAEKDVTVIYGIIPEKPSVYCIGAPESLTDRISDLETVRSLMRVELMGAGAEAIDFSKALRINLDKGKMFAQSTEALTDLAYYYMYLELASKISEHFDKVIPTDISEYDVVSYRVRNGAHASALGFDSNLFSEKIEKLMFKNNAMYMPSYNKVDRTRIFVTHNMTEGLPSAVVVRDSSGTGMLDLLAEHFSTMYVLAENNYNISNAILETVRPDYIIYLCDEGNIDSILTEKR